MKAAQENAAASGGRLSVTHEIRDGYEGADVVYANSWGALPYYGDRQSEGWQTDLHQKSGKNWRRNGIDDRPLVRPRRLMSMSALGTKRHPDTFNQCPLLGVKRTLGNRR
jgi:hypothetical protein